MSSSSESAGSVASAKFSQVPVFAAFAPFLCCVGLIWTILVYKQMCDSVMKVRPSPSLYFFSGLIWIFSGIDLKNMAESLNAIIEQRGLSIPKLDVKTIMILGMLPIGYSIAVYQVMVAYNGIAATEPA